MATTNLNPTSSGTNWYEYDLGSSQYLTNIAFTPTRIPTWARIKYYDGASWRPAALSLSTSGTITAPTKPLGVPNSLLLHYIASWPMYQAGTPTKNFQQISGSGWSSYTRPFVIAGAFPFDTPVQGSIGATWSGTFTGNNIAIGLWHGVSASTISVTIDGVAKTTNIDGASAYPYGARAGELTYNVESGTHNVIIEVTSGTSIIEYIGNREREIESWYSNLAWLRNGVPTNWTHDGIAMYDWELADSKGIVDGISTNTYGERVASVTHKEWLTDLNTAIANLKAMNDSLEQNHIVKLFPVWRYVSTSSWGALTLEEIQAANAKGATISESLAGVLLMATTTEHLTAIQQYWYLKYEDLFAGLSNIVLGGVNIHQEETGNSYDFMTAGMKTWLENKGKVIICHDYSRTTGLPANRNAHFTYEMPNIGFNSFPSTYTLSDLITVAQYIGNGNRGLNIELAPFNAAWGDGMWTDDIGLQVAFDQVAAAQVTKAKQSSICHFFAHVPYMAYAMSGVNEQAKRWYDDYCRLMSRDTTAPNCPAVLKESYSANTEIAVPLNITAQKLRIEFDAATTIGSINVTSEDTYDLDVLLHDTVIDLDVILNMPSTGLPLYIGSQQVQKIYLGSVEVLHTYKGSTLIF